ncbi:prepilin-type N-terminal cleavage/methylation domain-containing protein [Thalassotalea psychrophila]|uniref:Prepilin-type N-terminal cleavage/methylation domain-containing protein n=1 Tax=Thalassotalea psychrophila TaxID=3065647 RepID=A0ABY9TUV5_9GAMM|nr:prepilin-type N-terminal cleavage/methylation domain-containing protein [Colwelliaceae bacterium SQ149]
MKKNRGFTLLEVMLVLLVIGMILKTLVGNVTGSPIEDKLESDSQKFAALFTLASEYALLNNIELGLLVEEDNYQFLAFDGLKWVAVPDQDSLTQIYFEEPFQITLTLDDLPVDGQMIIDQSMFEGFEDEQAFEDEEELVYPQIFILSGGDITPFKLTFGYDDGFDIPMFFDVTGTYTIPLVVEGPFFDEQR